MRWIDADATTLRKKRKHLSKAGDDDADSEAFFFGFHFLGRFCDDNNHKGLDAA